MDRPTVHIPNEGGKTLFKTTKQDVHFGVGIQADDKNRSTALTYRINKSGTVNSKTKDKEKSGQGVTLNTKGSITRTPNGSSITNRNKLPGDRDPNKGGRSGEYKRRSPEDNDKKSSQAAGRGSAFTRGIHSLSAYINHKGRKSSEAPKRASSTRGADSSNTHGTHAKYDNDKMSKTTGGMTPNSTISTPIINGKANPVHTEVASVDNENGKQENGSTNAKKKSILKKLREKSSPTSDKGHEDVVDDDFDFNFRADGRIAGDVDPSGFVEKEALNSGKLKDGNINDGTQNATASGENKALNDSKSNAIGTSQNGTPNVDISHDRTSGARPKDQKSKGGASNSESGLEASHIGTQNLDVSVSAGNKEYSSCVTVTTTDESIVDLLVDVIVSSEDSTLHSGGLVAQIVAKRGGNLLDVYKECIRKMCPSIQYWTFQPTPAVGKLKSKHVFHAVVPPFTNHNQAMWIDGFLDLIADILYRTEHMGYESIAIPLLGTGNNGVPIDFVIDLLCEAIDEFVGKQKTVLHLQSICIVHPDKQVQKLIRNRTEKLKNCSPKQKRNKQGENKTKPKLDATVFFLKVDDRKKDTCPICMEEVSNSKLKQLSKCKHIFCKTCIEECFKRAPACPICNTVYGKIVGTQLSGIMVESFQRDIQLPGYDDSGTIRIFYSFLSGKQTKEHPNPGCVYKGTRRTAYLPDNTEGQKVHRLLRRAFEQSLVFTIGCSRTTGRDDVVTWNDIHHKTNTHGGPEKYGYPDPDYLSRVLEELAAKGITED